MAAFNFKVTPPGKPSFTQQCGAFDSALKASHHMRQLHPEGTEIEYLAPNTTQSAPIVSAVTIPASVQIVEPVAPTIETPVAEPQP